MRNIKSCLINEAKGAQLTEQECDALLRVMDECDFVKTMQKFNNHEVEYACLDAIKKLESAAQMEGGSLLDDYKPYQKNNLIYTK